MPDPQTIEDAVLEVLRECGVRVTFSEMEMAVRAVSTGAHAGLSDIECGWYWRDMDKALQRLRRRGQIRYLRSKADGGPGWVICELEEGDHD